MQSQDLLLSVSLFLLIATCAVVKSAANDDEPLVDFFNSFLPNSFLERPVSGSKSNRAGANSNVKRDTKSDDAMKAMLDALHGLNNIAKGLNSPDIGNCMFKCPTDVKPQPRPGFKPKPNGCGSHGLQIDVSDMPDITECCNRHDVCYGTCNNGQADCDQKFNACMADACVAMRASGVIKDDKRLKECEAMGATFHLAVVALGCEFYLDSQKTACQCSPKSGGHSGSAGSQEKIRLYNKEKRDREAAARTSTDESAQMEADEAEAVDFSSPLFDLPDAIDGHEEL